MTEDLFEARGAASLEAPNAEIAAAPPGVEGGTREVLGEGPVGAAIALVGEQPGDQEDLEGRPFVGPAGRLLDKALGDAGIDRRDAYVTNAVKHFRFTVKGKRRIHQTPGPEHMRACRPWLDAEFAVLQPEVVVCLGAVAAKALISPSFRITKDRGQLLPWTPPGVPAAEAGEAGEAAADGPEPEEEVPAQTWILATTHLHEHLGQAIAYARANGVVPPWSK